MLTYLKIAPELVLLTVCMTTNGCTTNKSAVGQPSSAVLPKCHLCAKTIPQGGGLEAQIVGEADARQYRCIHCALTDLAGENRQLTLNAQSSVSGQLIQLQRQHGIWTVTPATTVYLILPERANECLDLHQPFASRDEFDLYVNGHPEIAAQNPQAYTIEHYELILEAGKPVGQQGHDSGGHRDDQAAGR